MPIGTTRDIFARFLRRLISSLEVIARIGIALFRIVCAGQRWSCADGMFLVCFATSSHSRFPYVPNVAIGLVVANGALWEGSTQESGDDGDHDRKKFFSSSTARKLQGESGHVGKVLRAAVGEKIFLVDTTPESDL